MKSDAGSFTVAGSGGATPSAIAEYDESASPVGSVEDWRSTARASGPIVPPPIAGPAICVADIGEPT